MDYLFSIIIPTYNREKFLAKTLRGIFKQSYSNYELIVIDDGSNDNTRQVIRLLQKKHEIKYFKINHQGSQSARNLGLKLSMGDIITYVDSDDYIFNNYLSVAYKWFKKYPSKIFASSNYSRILELYENNKLVESIKEFPTTKSNLSVKDFYHWKVKTCGTGIFFKKEIRKKNIEWDLKIKRFQDWDFLLQLSRSYPHGYIYIQEVLFEYRQKFGKDSISSNASYRDWANGFEAIYLKYKNDPLMENQSWYPAKKDKYMKLQFLSDNGKIPPLIYHGLKMLKNFQS